MFKASLRSAAVALGALFLCTAQAAAFVVNQAGDQSDADINDGRADVDLVTAGDQTTLRAAIQEANKQTGVDTITFTGVITSLTVNGLPALTEPVVIQSPNPDAPVEIRILSGSTLQILDVTTGDTILTGLALPGGLRLRTSGSNQVTKCFVGTDGTGEVAANGNGLTINSAANIISNCLISGNNLDGVSISGSSATLNKIESSRIGTNKGGAAALQNKGDGVLIDNAPGTRITDCVISGNKTSGIHIKNAGATGTVIEKSRIGADNGGTAAIPNAGYGIFMENATDATIEDCIISGNGNGIGISHNNQATNVVIDSNLIGVAKGGTIALANTEGSGIYFDRSGSNIIHGNTISGNKGGGIIMSGSSGNNVVQGNFIGTDSAGTQAIGNGADGVYIDGGPGNTIGDPTGAEGNVISGNALNGITCNAGADTAIIGNMIGTDATGAKPLGNKFIGVNISRSDHAIIKKNVISGNGAGIYFAAFSGTSAGATAEGNFIGTGDGGSPAIPNDGTGVLFLGASNCTLGGTTPGAGNVIAFNKLDGVSVFDQDSVNDAILGNSIHENGGFGIDLAFDFEAEHHGGPKPMPNDPGDTDTGANNLQNYPVLVKEDGVPHGSLNSTPNTLFRVEFFANEKAGKLKHGEGETFIGFVNVTTDADGNADFNVPGAEKGSVITATATEIISDVPRSTSEFSKVIKAVGGGGIFVVNSIGDDGDANPGDGFAQTTNQTADGQPECTFRAAIQEAEARKKGKNKPLKIFFNLPGTDFVILPASPLPVITLPLIIDGTTQPGYAGGLPIVALKGFNAGNTTVGLKVIAGSSVIKGLAVGKYGGDGVVLEGKGKNKIFACDFTPNGGAGLAVIDSPDNQIGGPGSGQGNAFGINTTAGIFISGKLSKGNTVQGNLIVENGSFDPDVPGSEGAGIKIFGARETLIGGLEAGARNVIKLNHGEGIRISGAGAQENRVQGNAITENTARGIALLDGAPGNIIGGLDTASRNIISGNSGPGILARDGAFKNMIQGNYIGVTENGDQKFPNQVGIALIGVSDTVIGGTKGGAENVISGNTNYGILVAGSDLAPTLDTLIQGNFIGTDATGSLAALGNGIDGIHIDDAITTTIGGTKGGAGNVISANVENGIVVSGSLSIGTVIEGNEIGTGLLGIGTPLGNGGPGVHIGFGPTKNRIGGTKAASSNTIAFNGNGGFSFDAGVVIEGFAFSAVIGNEISVNHGLGIKLATGGNDSLPSPVLDAATTNGAKTFVTGNLNAGSLNAGDQFRIEFFGNDAADSSGFGEGQVFLGFVIKEADSGGKLDFAKALKGNFNFISATATAIVNGQPANTSEFSNAIAVSSPLSKSARSPLAGEGLSVVTFSDSDGDTVTARASGSGLIIVDGSKQRELTVRGTDARSRLTIRVAKSDSGDGVASFDRIFVDGPLGSLSAPQADIGALEVTGWLGDLWIRDLHDRGEIAVGGEPEQRTSIHVHRVGNGSTIRFGSGIRNFTAAHVGEGEIAAPSLGAMRINGDVELGLAGDFRANLTLSGEGLNHGESALGWLNVRGAIDSAAILVGGDIGRVSAARMTNSSLCAGCAVTGSTFGNPDGISFTIPARIGSATIGIDSSAPLTNSFIAAQTVGSVTLSSVVTDNGGKAFGIVGVSIDSVRVLKPPFQWLSGSHPADGVGDFRIQVPNPAR